MENNFVVIPHLMGGLGNRLFQICVAHMYSRRYNVPMKICMEKSDSYRYGYHDHFQSIFRKIDRIQCLPNSYVTFTESPGEACTFYTDIQNCNNNVLIVGYFQNEAYLNPYRDEILGMFRMEDSRKERLITKYPDLLGNSIFIHFRMKWIIKNDGQLESNEFHIIPMDKFYDRVLDKLKGLGLTDIKTYIFTESEKHMRESHGNILGQLPNHQVVYEDEIDSLYMMSLTKYGGVCSNSSFSWWGCYLNESPDKLSIMPDKWVNRNWIIKIQPKDAIVIPIE